MPPSPRRPRLHPPPSPSPPPPLPLDVHALIFRHLEHPSDLCAVSEVCPAFRDHLHGPHADLLWRRVWHHRARLSPAHLTWAAVHGLWRAQVAASSHIARLPATATTTTTTFPFSSPAPAVVFVPPRYHPHGREREEDCVRTRPRHIDVDLVLGRAVAVVALGRGVVIGFERGLAFLSRARQRKNPVAPRGRFARLHAPARATMFYHCHDDLGGVHMFAHASAGGRAVVVAAMMNDVLVRVDVDQEDDKAPLVCTVIDSYALENANVVEVATSEDGEYAMVGFCNGRVRVVHIADGGCRRVVAMREPPEMIVANGKWLIAANSFQPIACSVWEMHDGRPVHDFAQTSVGWEEITTVAGLSATRQEHGFALWNGYNAIRILNAKTGNFTWTIRVDSMFAKCPRSATEEAEHGAVSPHLGRRKMVLTADKKTAVVATSNRAFIVPIVYGPERPRTQQLDGAKRALLALSTDDRVLVTAESNVFGSLGSKVSGRASLAADPLLKFWDMTSGRLYGDLVMPSAVTSVSTAGDIVAAVAGAVGQVMVAFAAPN